MELNHLHLHVRDLARSEAFYGRHFGLREKWRGEGMVFLEDGAGFDLALVAAEELEALSAYLEGLE